MAKSPSGISLNNHSILVRQKAKKNYTPYSPLVRMEDSNGS